MRSVPRSSEPGFFTEVRVAHMKWEDLDGGIRRNIRDSLVRDFGPACAYCEQVCQPTQPRTETEETPHPFDEESIDHFRPRGRFPGFSLDWSNLVFACYRCNQRKDDQWPVFDDRKNQILTAAFRPRYTPVCEYVSPSETDNRRPAHEFFGWDFDSGEMMPAEQLDHVEWSIARRTIDDIDLNGELNELEGFDPDHIFNQRRYHLYLFMERLNSDSNFRNLVMQEAALPGQPFSGFISAYLNGLGPEVSP